MKKRKKKLILLGILSVLAVGIVFGLENNLLTMPQENEENRTYFANLSGEKTQANEEKQNILYTNNLSIEVVSCEKIEDTDIEAQTTYQPEYFKKGELPDAEYLEAYTDMEAIKEVCPELRDIWENDAHTIEEEKEIYNRNLDVIEQYTTMRHPKTRYFFVKCKITNLIQEVNETSVALDTFISSDQSAYLAMHAGAVYFDKAIHTSGEERERGFFWYRFEAGEVLECVLGYEIKEEWNENETYYIGVQTPGAEKWTLKNTQLVPLNEVLLETTGI